VAVVDVGGGSAQVVVGSRRDGPVWARSIDIGSQRLTSRLLGVDPAGAEALAAARAEVGRYLAGFDAPAPRTTLAVGGSARALKRLAGSRLGTDELDDVVDLLGTTSSQRLVDKHGVDPERVRTMAAGALILSEIQRRLGTPLKVVRAGLREGALLELAARRAAAGSSGALQARAEDQPAHEARPLGDPELTRGSLAEVPVDDRRDLPLRASRALRGFDHREEMVLLRFVLGEHEAPFVVSDTTLGKRTAAMR
jgi:exopolyphosphatase/pppGpp-phosphohydrolase